MTNYRRLISYIYAYEGDAKGKNIGFAKLESRNGQCKLSVNVKKVYVGSSDLGVYLLAPGKEIFLGSIFIRGGSGEFRAAVAVDNAADSGCSMDQCYGLTIHEKGESWRAYTTIWEDAVAQAAELELAEVTSENRGNPDEQIHKKIEELDRELKVQEDASGGNSVTELDIELIDIPVDPEVEESHRNILAVEEPRMSGEYDNPQNPLEAGSIQPKRLENNHISENNERTSDTSGMELWAEGTIKTANQVEEEAWVEAQAESIDGEFEQEASCMEKNDQEAPVGETTDLQNLDKHTAQRKWNGPEAEEIQSAQEAVLNERSGVVSGGISMNDAAAALVAAIATNRAAGTGGASVSAAGPAQPSDRSLTAGIILESGIAGRTSDTPGTLEMVPRASEVSSSGMPPTSGGAFTAEASPSANMPTASSRVRTINRAQANRMTQSSGAWPVQIARMSPIWGADRKTNLNPAAGTFPAPGANCNSNVTPDSGKMPVADCSQDVDISSASDSASDSAPMNQPPTQEQTPVVDAGEEALPLGDPQELARLEEEEQEYYQPQQLWEEFRKRYPKIQAFDSANGCEILTIKPQDIGLLPRENWNYGNNSFLLHGYYNYRYLVLARIGGGKGRIRYILGVPGHYYSNEKYMASMFGFPHFVLSKKQPSQDGRFGYWYTDIRLQNQD